MCPDIIFDYERTSLIEDKALDDKLKKLLDEVARLNEISKKGYETEYASINLPYDEGSIKRIKDMIGDKEKLHPNILIVIGIGGSNLGTIAVHEAVCGQYYNDKNPKVKVYYPDTVDSDKINDIMQIAEKALRTDDEILINVVSKTGTTTETAALFEMFLKLLKKYRPLNYQEYVVATTDRGSRLYDLALEKDFDILEIPKNVGGRYSVFSAVGLFPLGMLGLEIDKLIEGARKIMGRCLETDPYKNPAALSAAVTSAHIDRGKNINDMFIFSSDLAAIGSWYRQLMGESLGKEWDRTHETKINAGMTPTVSIGSTDLHSVAQLYLGGPRDKLTTFIKVKKNRHKVIIPEEDEGDLLIENIAGRGLQEIMSAIFEGVRIAFSEQRRPYVTIELKDKSEKSIAELLQFKMMEMIYLGYLLRVNPFDQPNVEAYKKETKRILSQR